MLKPLIRRQFFWTVLIFAIVLWGTHYASRLIFNLDRVDMLQHQLNMYQYVLENSPKDKRTVIDEMNAVNEKSGSPIRLDLLPNDGSLPSPGGFGGPPPGGFGGPTLFGFRLPGGPPGPPPGGPGGPFREVKLAGSDNVRLVLRLGPPPDGRNPQMMTGIIFIAITLASFLSVLFFFWRFREKAEVAKSVLSRMQHGDLKARFPTSKWDDAGQILGLFNQMADEIERLVESLRDNEKARMHLLQDLAHDLRTPVASLRNLIEGLNDDGQPLDPAARRELTALAFQETEYLTKLVEDLLFLALVIEPKYKAESNEISVQDLLQNQLVAVSSQYPKIKISHLYNSTARGKNLTTGNPHLLTRLLRNGLENAASFAKSTVEVGIQQVDDQVSITIRDDGPGFSKEALENFGKKRATRYLSSLHESNRISVGLGTVIMQAIANAHGGAISARNLLDQNNQVRGGEIKIVLRKSVDPTVTG